MNASPPTEIPADRSTAQARIDFVQHHLAKLPPVEIPIENRFTPGLYSRTARAPRGAAVVTRVHKTEHQFVISKGAVLVWAEGEPWHKVCAPYIGTTKPGARRVLIILEDCVWTTFHPTTTTDQDQLQSELTETPDVSYIEALPAEVSECLAGPWTKSLQEGGIE